MDEIAREVRDRTEAVTGGMSLKATCPDCTHKLDTVPRPLKSPAGRVVSPFSSRCLDTKWQRQETVQRVGSVDLTAICT